MDPTTQENDDIKRAIELSLLQLSIEEKGKDITGESSYDEDEDVELAKALEESYKSAQGHSTGSSTQETDHPAVAEGAEASVGRDNVDSSTEADQKP